MANALVICILTQTLKNFSYSRKFLKNAFFKIAFCDYHGHQVPSHKAPVFTKPYLQICWVNFASTNTYMHFDECQLILAP